MPHSLRLQFWAVALVALAAASVSAQPPARLSKAADGASPDEQAIRKAVVAFVELYNAHNADGLAALFAPDARMTFRNGDEVNGREEIKEAFVQAFTDGPKAAVSVDVESIRFLTPDVAVEEGFTS